jgi:uncharacterized protein (TIGR03546 family)
VTFLLKQFFSLLHVLNSETGHSQIAAGVACGLILGFAPALSLQTLFVLFVLFFFRIQIGAAFISAFVFKLVAYLLDPIDNRIGMSVLESESLRPLFTALYNMPLVPLTRFYNSIVMGSAIVSFILAVPAFFLARFLIIKYRQTILARIHHTKFYKALKTTKLFGLYAKYQELY